MLELSESKKKAQVLRLGGAQYSSVIAITNMIHREKGALLTTEKQLDEMHLQRHLAGGKLKDDKDSDNKDDITLAATNVKKGGKKSNGREKKENPNKDKTCNHYKKKGHIENTCWKKFPDKRPKLIKSHGGKQESKNSIATAAIQEEGEIILVLVTQGEKYVYLDDDKSNDNKGSILEVFTSKMEVQSVDISNAYQYAPIIESVKYLKGLDTCGESRPTDDNDEDKSQGGNVSFVFMDKTMLQPTMEGLVDKDAWIVDTGAMSHVTNSKVGGKNHCNTTVKTRGFVGESINPDLEMDIPVTYTCGNGKEIEAELKDVQVNEKFNFNLFSVTTMLQKRYTLKGDAKSITLEKGNHAFVFDSVIRTRGEHCTVQDSVGTRSSFARLRCGICGIRYIRRNNYKSKRSPIKDLQNQC